MPSILFLASRRYLIGNPATLGGHPPEKMLAFSASDLFLTPETPSLPERIGGNEAGHSHRGSIATLCGIPGLHAGPTDLNIYSIPVTLRVLAA